MKKPGKPSYTELNEHDRMILHKYAGYHTNYIESNTARNDALKNARYKDGKN